MVCKKPKQPAVWPFTKVEELEDYDLKQVKKKEEQMLWVNSKV